MLRRTCMTEISRQLREEIQRRGFISMADFMQAALYDSQYGYYSKPRPIGKFGDFFTSVGVGSLFGQLLAFQIARWFEELPFNARPAHCVEAGAHDGRLASDILDRLQQCEPGIFAAMQYWIVEPCPNRQKIQQATLSRFSNVRWFNSTAELRGRVSGVLFSNELLDSMPVHVFRWNSAAQAWKELGVGISNEQFVYQELPTATMPEPKFPRELLNVLPNGYTVELSPAAWRWWSEASQALILGRLMTIDYGGEIEELVSPRRSSGSLRAYSRHRVSLDVLKDPGEQDITADVSFTEIQHVGHAAGLRTEAFTTQSQFLTAIARDMWTRTGLWSQHQIRQFQTLIHPEHLGRLFRVLVQAR
jgi:SAM-dependent MidA family methyltransferase